MDILGNTSMVGIAGLLIFFLFFLGVITWVFRPGSTEKYRAWSNIPLRADNADNNANADLAERDE